MNSGSPAEPGKIFDIHVHLLAVEGADAEFLIMHSKLPQEDMSRILSGNAKRLLGM